jgi:hypothetical protein
MKTTQTINYLREISGCHATSMKINVLWAIALMTFTVNTSQMAVKFYQTTRRNNPENSHLNELFSLKEMRRKFYGLFPETTTDFPWAECMRLQIPEQQSIRKLPESSHPPHPLDPSDVKCIIKFSQLLEEILG